LQLPRELSTVRTYSKVNQLQKLARLQLPPDSFTVAMAEALRTMEEIGLDVKQHSRAATTTPTTKKVTPRPKCTVHREKRHIFKDGTVWQSCTHADCGWGKTRKSHSDGLRHHPVEGSTEPEVIGKVQPFASALETPITAEDGPKSEAQEVVEAARDTDDCDGEHSLIEEQNDYAHTSIEVDPEDPPLPTTELVRLTDAFRSDRKFVADKDSRYTPKFREMLQRPVFAEYKAGKCPEYFESARAAYAACYYLREDAKKQDIVEEASAEALRLYINCAHGNIASTCTECEPTLPKKLEVPFSIDGLRKLTLRLAERLKKQVYRRSSLAHLE